MTTNTERVHATTNANRQQRPIEGRNLKPSVRQSPKQEHHERLSRFGRLLDYFKDSPILNI
jgi:hypothetical protein